MEGQRSSAAAHPVDRRDVTGGRGLYSGGYEPLSCMNQKMKLDESEHASLSRPTLLRIQGWIWCVDRITTDSRSSRQARLKNAAWDGTLLLRALRLTCWSVVQSAWS